MKVLLIAQGYPPFPAAGSQRSRNVARVLAAHGHEVHVLTQRLPQDDSPFRRTDEGILVEVINPWRTLVDVYGAFRRYFRRAEGVASGAAPGVQGGREDLSKGGPAWRRWIRSMLMLPDHYRGLIPPAVARGLTLARRGVDLVYTTSPAHSCHIAGLMLKRLTGIPWVAELRDPWVVEGCPHKPLSRRSRLGDAIERKVEAATLRSADLVVVVSQSHLELLRNRPPSGAPHRVELILNGIPGPLAPAPKVASTNNDRPKRIVHLGNIYRGRDPQPFFEALHRIREAGELDRSVDVHFIGEGMDRFEAPVAALGLQDVVTFQGWVPHSEGQEMLKSADLCLLIAQNWHLQVPNKLYEYLQTRKPILALADAEGETASILRKVGGHYLVTGRDSPERVQAVVRAALEGDPSGRVGPRSEGSCSMLASWSTDRQMKRLMALLEGLSRNSNHQTR